MFLGIYHHAPDATLQAAGVHAHEVKDTWVNEAIAFGSSYAAKTALWIKALPL